MLIVTGKTDMVNEETKTKRRIVVDLRRSGTNYKSRVPQRIVLPRTVDSVRGVRNAPDEPVLAKREAAEVSTGLFSTAGSRCCVN